MRQSALKAQLESVITDSKMTDNTIKQLKVENDMLKSQMQYLSKQLSDLRSSLHK